MPWTMYWMWYSVSLLVFIISFIQYRSSVLIHQLLLIHLWDCRDAKTIHIRQKICFIPSRTRFQYWVLIQSVTCHGFHAMNRWQDAIEESSPPSWFFLSPSDTFCVGFLLWGCFGVFLCGLFKFIFPLFLITYFSNPRVLFNAFTYFLWCLKCCYSLQGSSGNVVCSLPFTLWFTL